MENNDFYAHMIAADLLVMAKTIMNTTAVALTEFATPEVHSVLAQQFQSATEFHNALTHLVHERGWYDAYDMETQIRHDARLAQWVYQMR